MKYLVHISRILVGVLFIISGFVKLIDPLGMSYKLQEYFSSEVLNIPFLEPYALAIAVFVVVFEVVLGVFLLIGYKPKFTIWSLLAMIVFFTFLTFYSWYFDKVKDCGCFGDALKLEPFETFIKDLVLLALVLILLFGIKHIKPIFSKFVLTVVALLSFVASLGLSYHVLMHLPIIDFRAYAIGNNFQENMTLPDDAKDAVIEYTWKFNVNGQEKEFITNGSYPTVDGKYISVDTKVIDEGDEPLILDFSIESEDEDLTTHFLEKDNLIMIVAYNLETAEVDGMKKLKAFSENAIKKGYTVIGLSSSGREDKQRIREAYDLNFDFYLCDEKVLKTIVRSNPGVLTLKKGTVTQKEHWNDLEEIELESLPNATPKLNFELKKELKEILKLDQGIREVFSTQDEEQRNSLADKYGIPIQKSFADYFPLSREIDSTNMKAIKAIINEHGYPGRSLVGEPENVAAWYVIQHSNEISKYLPLIKKAANNGEIPKRLAAMMEDRNLMRNGEAQIYGTQGKTLNINTPNQVSLIWPIKDFENVNKRRKEVGYEATIEDYAKDLYGDDFKFKNYTLEEVKALEKN